MRLLHLTTFLQGGAGLAIAELAASQAALGHEVTVIASKTGAPGYGNDTMHIDALARGGVPMLAVDSSFKRDPAQNLEVVQTVLALAGRDGFDLIHTHAATPSRIALMARDRCVRRTPVLQTMHGWGMAKSAADAQADVATLNQIDRVVVPAEHSASLLRSLGVSRAPLSVVPYGVRDEAAPAPIAGDPVLEDMRRWRSVGGQVLCCVGTIGARKNQHLVIEALQAIAKAERPLVVFVGDGDTDGLRDQAAGAGVIGSIRIVGYRADVRAFLAAADAFVLASLSEGQPLAVIEAWRDGVPVIVSDIPEMRELVDDGVTGFLFESGSALSLASAIWAVGRLNRSARMSLAARVQRVYQTRFTAAAMVADYMNEYAAVAARAAARVAVR